MNEKPVFVNIHHVLLKSRKEMERTIPRERLGWWHDVCAGERMVLRDATAADLARCCMRNGDRRGPADFLCELPDNGSLVSVEAIAHRRTENVPVYAPPAPSASPAALTDGQRRAAAKAMVEVFLGFPAPDREPGDLDLRAVDAVVSSLAATAPSASPAALTLIREKLERFEACAGDDDGCDIGREWFDALTTLGLLERTQRSPAMWSMTPAGEALLAAQPAASEPFELHFGATEREEILLLRKDVQQQRERNDELSHELVTMKGAAPIPLNRPGRWRDGDECEPAAPAPASPAALAVTDAMVYAFHRATTDGPLGEADFNEIRDALASALLAAQPAAPTKMKPTPKMIAAFKEAYKVGSFWTDRLTHAIEAMMEAAPAAPLAESRQGVALSDEEIRSIALNYARFVFPGVYSIKEYDCEEDFFNCVRALIARASSSQGVALSDNDDDEEDGPAPLVEWDKFPGWLIDHHEGGTITEELLQHALADMLKVHPARASSSRAEVEIEAARYRWLRTRPGQIGMVLWPHAPWAQEDFQTCQDRFDLCCDEQLADALAAAEAPNGEGRDG